MKANWRRVGLIVWERANMAALLAMTTIAAFQIPAYMTLPETHLPTWWVWDWAPPNRATGAVFTAVIVAAWIQHGVARRRMRQQGIIGRKAES